MKSLVLVYFLLICVSAFANPQNLTIAKQVRYPFLNKVEIKETSRKFSSVVFDSYVDFAVTGEYEAPCGFDELAVEMQVPTQRTFVAMADTEVHELYVTAIKKAVSDDVVVTNQNCAFSDTGKFTLPIRVQMGDWHDSQTKQRFIYHVAGQTLTVAFDINTGWDFTVTK